MTALVGNRDTRKLAGGGPVCDIIRYRTRANMKFFVGAIVLMDAGNYAVPGTQTANGVNAVGRCEKFLDTTGLADGAVEVEVRSGIFKWTNNMDSLSTATTFGTGSALFTATPKRAGLTLTVVQGVGTSTPYSYTVVGNAFVLTLPTDGGAAANGTPNSLDTYFAALAASDPLKLAMTLSKSTGTTGTLLAAAVTALSGYLGETILVAANQNCYVLDDQTLVATSLGSTRGIAGKVRRVDSDGVYVTTVFP